MKITIPQILECITDKQTSNIFKSVASAKSNSDILITQLKLTRKQYYSRMSLLTQLGLVKRQRGTYHLTAFGKVVYKAQLNFEVAVENAINDYWKLRAIDTLRSTSDIDIERKKIISTLIENEEIRGILIKKD